MPRLLYYHIFCISIYTLIRLEDWLKIISSGEMVYEGTYFPLNNYLFIIIMFLYKKYIYLRKIINGSVNVKCYDHIDVVPYSLRKIS